MAISTSLSASAAMVPWISLVAKISTVAVPLVGLGVGIELLLVGTLELLAGWLDEAGVLEDAGGLEELAG